MHDVMAKPLTNKTLTKSRSKILQQAIKKSPARGMRKASPKTAGKTAGGKTVKGKWVYAFGGGKAGAFAAEQVAHRGATFGLAATERTDPFAFDRFAAGRLAGGFGRGFAHAARRRFFDRLLQDF